MTPSLRERPERLDTITLRRVRPAVFRNDPQGESGIWLTDLQLKRGDVYAVEAPSGAGKSSLCAFLTGARNDYDGTILFNATDIRTMDIKDWQLFRRHRIAYLPQELALFPELTAWENIMVKNRLTGHLDAATLRNWMEMLGIESRRDWPAGRMSVGQQQRLALIRALAQPFDFLLLDEPVSHLDEANNRIATGIILSEARRQQAAVISTSVGNPLLLPDPIPLKL